MSLRCVCVQKKKKKRVRRVKESADDTLCEKSASRANKQARQLTSAGVEHWGGWEEVVKQQGLVEGTRGIVSRAFCGETFRSSCVSAALNGDVVLCQCRTSDPHPSPPLPILPQIHFVFPPHVRHRGGRRREGQGGGQSSKPKPSTANLPYPRIPTSQLPSFPA